MNFPEICRLCGGRARDRAARHYFPSRSVVQAAAGTSSMSSVYDSRSRSPKRNRPSSAVQGRSPRASTSNSMITPAVSTSSVGAHFPVAPRLWNPHRVVQKTSMPLLLSYCVVYHGLVASREGSDSPPWFGRRQHIFQDNQEARYPPTTHPDPTHFPLHLVPRTTLLCTHASLDACA